MATEVMDEPPPVYDSAFWEELSLKLPVDPDPASEENEDDGFGSENSVLRLGALGRPETMERVLADGAVNTAALAHDPALPLYRHRLADGRVRLRYRTLD